MKIVQQPTPPTKRLGDCEPGDVVQIHARSLNYYLVTDRREGDFVWIDHLSTGDHGDWDADAAVYPVDCELRIL